MVGGSAASRSRSHPPPKSTPLGFRVHLPPSLPPSHGGKFHAGGHCLRGSTIGQATPLRPLFAWGPLVMAGSPWYLRARSCKQTERTTGRRAHENIPRHGEGQRQQAEVLNPGPWVLGPGLWILGPWPWILGPGSWALASGSSHPGAPSQLTSWGFDLPARAGFGPKSPRRSQTLPGAPRRSQLLPRALGRSPSYCAPGRSQGAPRGSQALRSVPRCFGSS